VPAQSDMYPLCPYHAAWNPTRPLGNRAGGGMPGPTLLAQVAACAGASCVTATTSATADRTFAKPPTKSLTRERCQWYVGAVSAARCGRSHCRRHLDRRAALTYDKGTAEWIPMSGSLWTSWAGRAGASRPLRSGHVMAYSPDQQTIVRLPGTPGDRRWKRIVLPKLRRGGFEEGR